VSRERSPLGDAIADLDPVERSPGVDPFFARRVMSVLPAPLRGGRLSPKRRARVLAAFYGGAIVLGLALAWILPESLLVWSDRAHGLAHGAASSSGGSVGSWPLILGVAAAVLGAVLALAPSRVDTPAT